jgi:hypothetical protein
MFPKGTPLQNARYPVSVAFQNKEPCIVRGESKSIERLDVTRLDKSNNEPTLLTFAPSSRLMFKLPHLLTSHCFSFS